MRDEGGRMTLPGHRRGIAVKALAWISGLAALAVAALFAVNATDETLSDLSRKAMAVPAAPATTPDNGYPDFVALGAAGLDDRLKRACGTEPGRCLEYVENNPGLVQLAARAGEFAARYRRVRGKPQFVELWEPKSPEDLLPPFQYVIWGQGQSLLTAARIAAQGNPAVAIAELELENDFHRRAAAGARSLVFKVVVYAALQRDAFFASELARLPGAQTPALLARLKGIARPLTDAEADVRRVLEIERGLQARWMSTRSYVRLPDSEYRNDTRPW